MAAGSCRRASRIKSLTFGAVLLIGVRASRRDVLAEFAAVYFTGRDGSAKRTQILEKIFNCCVAAYHATRFEDPPRAGRVIPRTTLSHERQVLARG